MNNRYNLEGRTRTRSTGVRRRTVVPMLLATLLAAGVAPGATRTLADRLVPFQATLTEQFSGVQCGPTALCVRVTGTGTAAHLGRVTDTRQVRIDLSTPATGCLPVLSDTMTLTAANGDQVFATGTGQNCVTSNPDVQNETVIYTVTGGTGRFSAAGGSGTWHTHVVITAETATTSMGTATTSASGLLASPGATR